MSFKYVFFFYKSLSIKENLGSKILIFLHNVLESVLGGGARLGGRAQPCTGYDVATRLRLRQCF